MIGGLRADASLLAYMWEAAESRLDEHPDKVWIVALSPVTPAPTFVQLDGPHAGAVHAFFHPDEQMAHRVAITTGHEPSGLA